jgi:large subunit ribosomal protein L25
MEIIAQKREIFGKKAQGLSADRKIPAVMFGKGLESLSVTIGSLQFAKVYAEAGETGLVDLNVDGKAHKVLIKDVQLDPISLNPIHIGFYKVNLKEKTRAQIPVEVIGEETHPLIKSGEALVLVLLNEISVEALPADLPSKFEINLADLPNVGDAITIGQLNFDKSKVEILDHEADDIVVKLDHAGMAEEPVEVEPVSEADAISKVAATRELSEEEKAKRAAEEKAEKEQIEKDKKKK